MMDILKFKRDQYDANNNNKIIFGGIAEGISFLEVVAVIRS